MGSMDATSDDKARAILRHAVPEGPADATGLNMGTTEMQDLQGLLFGLFLHALGLSLIHI